jgi:DNA-binding transcriptional LysR family regulator
LGINQSTVFRKLAQIERQLDARLFKRNRARTTLTPRGEEMVRLAESIEQDVSRFEKSPRGKVSGAKPFITGLVPAE